LTREENKEPRCSQKGSEREREVETKSCRATHKFAERNKKITEKITIIREKKSPLL
jgi:hypothetical protein